MSLDIVKILTSINQCLSIFFGSYWGNLLSGFLGAALLYFFQKSGESKSLKNEAKNLAQVLINDLSLLTATIKSRETDYAKLLSSSIMSANISRSLTEQIIRLLPSDLVKELIETYSKIEIALGGNTLQPRVEGMESKVLAKLNEVRIVEQIEKTIASLNTLIK